MSLDLHKINALVTLLGDPDQEVMQIAEREILTIGKDVIPVLEDSYLLIENNQQKDKLDEIINNLKSEKVRKALREWVGSKEKDLLDAWCIISEVSGRKIDRSQIVKDIEQVKVEIWLGLQSNQSVVEKINYFNYIFYRKNEFTGDTKDYNHPSNTYIDTVLQNRKGNPISLSVIYLIIAQKLNLPVYGVNLPQHFVLAFMNLEIDLLNISDIEKLSHGNDIDIPIDKDSDPLFYINPFNKGTIFSKNHLLNFLKELKIKPNSDYYKICDEQSIIRRMLRNLQVSFAKSHNIYRKEEIDHLLEILNEK